MADVGGRIKRARKREGLTLQRLADEVGCSLATIKRLEASPDYPTGGSVIVRVERRLGLSLSHDSATDLSDPDDPPLSRASERQLINELQRRIEDREPL